mgnify:CR=1 FL=1|tara:strand:+ start:22517 stop:23470 length:954 start_codon:yes stop_codon:yes gene_type:complete
MEKNSPINNNKYLPKTGSINYITVLDGTRLRWGFFPAMGEKKATILLVSGHREFIEKQTEFIEDLQNLGFDVYAYDHRGQGGSDRKLDNKIKSHNPEFGLIVEDMHEVVMQLINPDMLTEPLYLCAHSMGAQFAMRYLHDHPSVFERAVLMVPFTNFNIGSGIFTFFTKLYAHLANLIGFSEYFAPGQAHHRGMIKHDQAFSCLTHDRTRYAWSQHALDEKPELFIGGVTFGWLKGVMKSMKLLQTPGYVDAIDTPLLVLLADEEYVVDNEMTIKLVGRMKNARYETIKGARHELYREADEFRDQVLEKITAFLLGN